MHRELLNFVPGEVSKIIVPIFASPILESKLHIGRLLHCDIVRDHKLAVFAENDILFDVVGSLCVSHCFCRFGMFNGITASTSMSDDNRLVRLDFNELHGNQKKQGMHSDPRGTQSRLRVGRRISLSFFLVFLTTRVQVTPEFIKT